MSLLDAVPAGAFAELTPLVRRVADLDAGTPVRLRLRPDAAVALARLPFGVLVARTITATDVQADGDLTLRAGELLAWLDDASSAAPPERPGEWRGTLPPDAGWRRVETIPDSVIRPLVRTGALTLKEAAQREGLPNRQPSRATSDAVLDAVVLTVTGPGDGARGADTHHPPVEIRLRTLSALTRMGFLARDSDAHIEVNGRWARVAGRYGSVYAQSPGGLDLVLR